MSPPLLLPVFRLSGCRVFFSSRLELDRSRYMKSGSSVSSDAVDEGDPDEEDIRL